MLKTAITVGPLDQGRHMNLDDFDQAEVQAGNLYELSRGVIIVSDVPKLRHLAQVEAARLQFHDYRRLYPRRIRHIAGSGECKLLIRALETERHPDLAVYKTSPLDEEDLWASWIPEIVIEIISPWSEERDYVLKREEYLLFGVTEYWILDADKEEMTVHRRSNGVWTERTLEPPQIYRTRLLPGFKFSCAKVFEAARKAV